MAFKRKYSRSRKSFRRNRRGKYGRKRGARSFQSRVTRVLMKKAETKFFDIGLEDQQLYHNLGWGTTLIPPTTITSLPTWFNPWINILQGSGRFNRIGDDITPRGISMKLWVANKTDRENTKVRIIVARIPKLFGGVVTTASFDPLQIANQGTNGNNLLKPPDTDKGVKFLYDRIHVVGSQQVNNTAAKEKSKVIKLWIARKGNRTIKYDTTSTQIVNNPLAVYCIPYEQYSTLTTDRVASIAGFMRMYYKDV